MMLREMKKIYLVEEDGGSDWEAGDWAEGRVEEWAGGTVSGAARNRR